VKAPLFHENTNYCNLVNVTWHDFDQWHAHISRWGTAVLVMGYWVRWLVSF